MSITSYDNRRTFAGNGGTLAFAFPPPFTSNNDLVVQRQAADGTITTLILATDYTVTGAGNPAGGTVTTTVAPATGTTLIIYRDVPLTQPVTLLDGGPLPAATVNGMLDRITMWGQRLKEQIGAIGSTASATVAGLMSAADKAKLDGIAAGAQVNAVTSVAGRTGAVAVTKADVGLGNADNTSDASKPVSTAQAAADALRLAIANNLSDLNNAGSALTNLGGTTVGKSVFTASNSSTALTALGAGTTGTALFAAANAAAAQSTLGLVPGTNVQTFSARLADIAGIAPVQGDILYFNGTTWAKLGAGTNGQFFKTQGTGANPLWASIPGGGDMLSTNNLSDVANASTARTNLGLGTAATVNTGTASGNIPVLNGSGQINPAQLPSLPYTEGGGIFAYEKNVINGYTIVDSRNSTTGADSRAIYRMVTGTPNSSYFLYLKDGAGSPTAGVAAGSAVTSFSFGFDTITWNSNAGSLRGTLDSSGFNLPTGAAYKINGTALGYSNLSGFGTAAAANTGTASGNVPVLDAGGKLATGVLPVVPIANGGTNLTTYIAGDMLYASAANVLSKLGAGSNGQVLTLSGGVPSWAAAAGGMRAPDIWVRDEKASGTNGGGFTSGADRTRDLNTIKVNNIGASLASNQLTLPAGTYYLHWRAPSLAVSLSQSWLYNVTAGAVVERGSSCSGGTTFPTIDSIGAAMFTLSNTSLLELRHRSSGSQATNGFGAATSLGTEIYAELWGWKIA